MNRKLVVAAMAVSSLIIIAKSMYAEQVKIYNCPDGRTHCVTINVGGGGTHTYHKGN
jgi:hypothetical protein